MERGCEDYMGKRVGGTKKEDKGVVQGGIYRNIT